MLTRLMHAHSSARHGTARRRIEGGVTVRHKTPSYPRTDIDAPTNGAVTKLDLCIVSENPDAAARNLVAFDSGQAAR